MRRKRDIVVWHRLMGVTLADVLPSSLLGVEAEREVSVKRQFLDIVIVRKRPGEISEPLPDGLDDLAQHNLVTYKSQHQALDAWAIEELIGHMVSYRKLVSPSPVKLLPREQFQMYGISTRYPEKLRSEVKLEERQPGLRVGAGNREQGADPGARRDAGCAEECGVEDIQRQSRESESSAERVRASHAGIRLGEERTGEPLRDRGC